MKLQSLQRALTPNVADEELRRHGFAVVSVSLAMTILVILVGGNAVLSTGLNLAGGLTLCSAPLFGACIVLALKGMVRPSAYFVAWFPCLILLVVLATSPHITAVFFLAIPILLASVVLPSIHTLPVTFVAVVATIVLMPRATYGDSESFIPAVIFLLMICALGYLGARSVEQALQVAGESREKLGEANTALAETNTALEERVSERTATLQQANDRLQEREAELQQTVYELQISQETIQNLSAPILPVADGVLIAPLIGVMDNERVAQVMHSLLSTAEQARAHFLIIDVTGISLMDTQIANSLLQITQALRLLGARVMLTGIRPEVAQTLVGLGIELRDILIQATLQEGIAEALKWKQR
jgi:rsbT co-antagonist protein RsbR